MAGGVTVQLTGVPELRKALQKARTEALDVTKKRLAASGLEMETEAKRNITDAPAVDTGKTRASIHYVSEDAGMTAAVHAPGVVSQVIEFGSAPHFPPIAPLEAWALRHGLPPGSGFVIARAISQHGTPARPFMLPAWKHMSAKFLDDLRVDLNRFLESLKA